MSLLCHCIDPVGLVFLYGLQHIFSNSVAIMSERLMKCSRSCLCWMVLQLQRIAEASGPDRWLNCHIAQPSEHVCLNILLLRLGGVKTPRVVERDTAAIDFQVIASRKTALQSQFSTQLTPSIKSYQQPFEKKMLAVLNYCWWPTTFFAFLQINCFIL